jgi:hypothetical protein
MLAGAKWRTVSWHSGTKGRLKARFVAVRVRTADGPPQRIWDKGQQHLVLMIGKKTRRPKAERTVTSALARWEGEGGGPKPNSENNRDTRAALAREEEHVLRCLGAAVISSGMICRQRFKGICLTTRFPWGSRVTPVG